MKSILLVAGAGLATAVSAANVSWTGASGDGQWGTAGNWSTGTVPTSADVAVFAKAKLASGAVVKLGADQQVGAIQFSDDVQNVTFDGKTGESRHALTLTGGGITGNSNKKTIATFDCDVYLSRPASVRGEYTGNLRFLGRFGSAADAQTPVDISFDGVQNGNAYLIGTVENDGRLLVKGNTVKLGVSGATGGRIARATSIDIDASEIVSAPNFNSTLRFENDGTGVNADRLADDIPVRSLGNGGQLAFGGSPSQPVEETIGRLDLQAPLTVRLGEKVNNVVGKDTTVTVLDVAVSSLGYLGLRWEATGTGNFFRLPGRTNDAGGIVGPWAFQEADDSCFLTIGENGVVTPLPYSQYRLLTDADATSIAKLNDNQTTVISEAKSVWALYMRKNSAIEFGTEDLTIASGGIVMCNGGTKTIRSAGGALVFGDEALRINSQKSSMVDIACPLKWRRPEDSTVPYPHLVVRKANNSAPPANFALTGEDLVGDWGDVYCCALTNSNQISGFELGGPSTRRIHGRLSGLCKLRKSGSGTLVFEPTFTMNARNITGVIVEGRVVTRVANGPVPVFDVEADASFETDANALCTSRATVKSGGRLMGLGRFKDVVLNDGAILRGGSDTTGGCLLIGGNPTVKGNLRLEIPVDATTVGEVRAVGNLTMPAGASTVTVCVNAVAGKDSRRIRTTDSFRIFGSEAGKTLTNGDAPNWTVVTETPRWVDVSKALVTRDDNGYVLTGIDVHRNGLAVSVR